MADEKKRNVIILVVIAAIVVIVLGVLLFIHESKFESTDDAFIDGHIIPISAKVAGQVVTLNIIDNQVVKKGDLLLEIDPRDYQASLDQQRAKVTAAEAEAIRASADSKRYEEIFQKDEISKQQLDQAQASAVSAEATARQEKAALEQDQLNLSYTRIVAPEDGQITRRSVEAGSYIQVGQTLFSLVPSQVWVTANYKETQLTHMRVGQHVTIKVDSFPGQKFEGHVDSVQLGTGERFSALPPENATGNYVKVVQRLPVKILIDTPPDPQFHLAPGMSVEPEVQVKD